MLDVLSGFIVFKACSSIWCKRLVSSYSTNCLTQWSFVWLPTHSHNPQRAWSFVQTRDTFGLTRRWNFGSAVWRNLLSANSENPSAFPKLLWHKTVDRLGIILSGFYSSILDKFSGDMSRIFFPRRHKVNAHEATQSQLRNWRTDSNKRTRTDFRQDGRWRLHSLQGFV